MTTAILLSVGLLAACDSTPQMMDHSQMGNRTPSQVVLYKDMQTLWQQHMEWTYAAVAALATDAPNVAETADRLMKNQEDIGNAVKPFYGEDAGNALTVLLKAHISGAVDILVAAKEGDGAAQDAAVTAEYANAKEIGDFLSAANPSNWSQASMEEMMKGHIDQTLVYATDLLSGRYADAIDNYGLAEAHMVEMGDMLSAGIIAQFPTRFDK
ncbi:MAG: hypothetical protein WBF71_00090 [Microthrixaceae bacterium]